MKAIKFRFSSWQIIALGYLTVILLGSFLLSLPISNKANVWTPYINALFTATSATCVTGLAVYDTFLHFSLFGQFVILFLVQVGGIGFMTVVTLFAIVAKRKIGLYERKILMDTAGTMQSYGIIKLIKRILIGTLIIETVGAILLMVRFIPAMGFWKGFYYGIFHSVSAFCNSGFDLMGYRGAFSSLTAFTSDALVNITFAFLIIMGGLGFIVWNDILEKKGNPKKFLLYTKVVLLATLVLIVLGSLMYYLFEKDNVLAGKSAADKVFISLFSVITTRTAGFNYVNINSLTDSGKFLSMVLMLIGGSSGSTAGGIKITTFIVIFLSIIANVRNNNTLEIGKRRLEPGLENKALAILASYLFIIFTAVTIVCAIEPFSLTSVTFEIVGAVSTAGLSLGITPFLSTASKVLIIFTMFAGRVGVLNLVMAISEKKDIPPVKRPIDKLLIG